MGLDIRQYDQSYAWFDYKECKDNSDLLSVLVSDYKYATREIKKYKNIAAIDKSGRALSGLENYINATIKQFRSFLLSQNELNFFDDNYKWKLPSGIENTPYNRAVYKLKGLKIAIKKFSEQFKLQLKNHVGYSDNLLEVGGSRLEFEIGSIQDSLLKTLFSNSLDAEWKPNDLTNEIAKYKGYPIGTIEYEKLNNNSLKRAVEEINKRVRHETNVSENLIARTTNKVRLNTKLFHTRLLI